MKSTRLILVLLTVTLVLSFQNCSDVNFGVSEFALSERQLSTTDIIIETSMNTPKEFKLNEHSLEKLTVTFIPAQVDLVKISSFEILDKKSANFKYTPAFGFRGKEKFLVKLEDKVGDLAMINLTVIVGNTLSSLEPALAVRGMGCIQCHAEVASNIITDFGYKNDYYFSQNLSGNWWKSGGIYGDHDNKFHLMKIPADKRVFVPAKARLPASVSEALGIKTLSEYVRSQFSISNHESSKLASVQEKERIYIGAPTNSDLTSAFKLSESERIKYFKEMDSSSELAGIVDEGTFFKNSGTVLCEGDLVLRGPLLLEKLQISSKSGCRIYVIGSVFLYGPISYLGMEAETNLQITSSKSISMGLGHAKRGDAFCEPESRFATENASYGDSTLTVRYSTFWTVPGNFVRQSSKPKEFGDSILAEAALISSKVGTLYDAACREEGRQVSFERILLNAPIIHSRYEGNVKGTVIAEISLMSLGKFKFSFDPVFSQVPVLPFLEKSKYLDVQ